MTQKENIHDLLEFQGFIGNYKIEIGDIKWMKDTDKFSVLISIYK